MSRDPDTISENHGELLAHIIDSRVAARDALALLCSVERWQEAWFRDNSFLIACLIHTIRNYTAICHVHTPPFSRDHSRENDLTRLFGSHLVRFPSIFQLSSLPSTIPSVTTNRRDK